MIFKINHFANGFIGLKTIVINIDSRDIEKLSPEQLDYLCSEHTRIDNSKICDIIKSMLPA